jgi:hypothetical protein
MLCVNVVIVWVIGYIVVVSLVYNCCHILVLQVVLYFTDGNKYFEAPMRPRVME